MFREGAVQISAEREFQKTRPQTFRGESVEQARVWGPQSPGAGLLSTGGKGRGGIYRWGGGFDAGLDPEPVEVDESGDDVPPHLQ